MENTNKEFDEITKEELVQMILSLSEFQYRKGLYAGFMFCKDKRITEKQAYNFRYKDKTFNRAKCVFGGNGERSMIQIIEWEPFIRTISFNKLLLKQKFVDFLKKHASEKQKKLWKYGV
jgi:hypothetical protein